MFSFVTLKNVCFSYEQQTCNLLTDISLALHTGWTSLCGVNGSGKSTMFKLISGELLPNSGTVERLGRTYCIPQETSTPPKELEDFASDYSRKAIRLRAVLGIEEGSFDRWDCLSRGERKRIQIAVALASEPDILLVDEPSNHLDEQAREVILKELRKFCGIGILISHDRQFLNSLCSHTIFIEQGTCTSIQSNYDTAKQELVQTQNAASHTRDAHKEKLKGLSRLVQTQSAKVSQTKSKFSKRGLDKKDHDTKAKINLARVSGADHADSRKKRVLTERHEKLATELSSLPFKKEYKLGAFFGAIHNKRRLNLKQEVWSTDFMTINCPELIVEAGEHVAITGPNGSGKSTFLNLWLERLETLPIQMSLAKQEIEEAEKSRLMKDFSHMDADRKGAILTLVSCFGSDPKSLVEGGLASPGVWQKVVIAKAIVDGSPFLFLDEPTNHMDLAAVEVLEQALQSYQGTLVLISHDRVFLEQVCTRELAFTKNESMLCEIMISLINKTPLADG